MLHQFGRLEIGITKKLMLSWDNQSGLSNGKNRKYRIRFYKLGGYSNDRNKGTLTLGTNGGSISTTSYNIFSKNDGVAIPFNTDAAGIGYDMLKRTRLFNQN